MLNKRFLSISIKRPLISLGVLAAFLFAFGMLWDTYIHVYYAHTLLAVPHVIVLAGFAVYGVIGLSACRMLLKDKKVSSSERNSLKIVALGTLALPGAFGDELWHKISGIDMTAWSFPHLFILLSMASVLVGLVSLEINQTKRNFSQSAIRPSKWLLVFFASSVFFILMFAFMDFDAPDFHNKLTRPPISYPIAMTGTFVFGFTLITCILEYRGIISITTFIAWVFYVGTGLATKAINLEGVAPQILPPFPIFFPAIFFDIAIAKYACVGKIRASPRVLNPAIFMGATACYWGVVAWAKLYNKLPQSLSGGLSEWAMWYFITLAITFASAGAAYLLYEWIFPKESRGYSPQASMGS